MFEDEHAEAFAPSGEFDDIIDASDEHISTEDVLASTVEDIEAAQDAPAEQTDEQEDDIGDILARLEADETAAPVEPEAVAATTGSQADDDDALGLDTLAALMAADDDAPTTEDDSADNIFDDAADGEGTDTVEQPAQPRARVIKVKRADIDAAIASGALEEVEETAADTTLSAADEAELLAELAEVEAELPTLDGADEEIIDAVDFDEVKVEADRPSEPEAVKDDDVQRLMAEAENQMG